MDPDRRDPAVVGADGQASSVDGLVVCDLSMRFGATRALDDVGFAAAAGSIHALLGGNGSGKSTTIKILAGLHHGATGTVAVGGRTTAASSITPSLSRDLGLRFVHQDPGVIHDLTVAENIALGSTQGFPTRGGAIRWRALRQRCQRLLDRFEIDVRPNDRLGALRPADQTAVAIARALEDTAEEQSAVLALDEPTASLPEHEVEVLLAALRRYAVAGHTILYVSHRLEEVLSIADAFTILRDGRHVVTRSAAGVTVDQLVQDIVGEPLAEVYAEDAAVAEGDDALVVTGLAVGPVRDVSFTLKRGEVLGIAGLLGSGRTEMLRAIYGATARDGGQVQLAGRTVNPRRPIDALAEGICYVPEDRATEAAFPELALEANLAVGHAGRYWRRGRWHGATERRDAEQDVGRFRIKTSSTSALFSSLSGGNQQKGVLARAMRWKPRILLLDEPTQGVDVGARADIYASLREECRSSGMGVVVVSSDFEELCHAADRILVLRNGRLVAELTGARRSTHRLTQLVHGYDGEDAHGAG